ncbi:MAG: hypothetical protein JWQ38_3122 [Flavipsychrobacter sp.]|nr:hypothetical protein [Flavipsychrobacter sp.]
MKKITFILLSATTGLASCIKETEVPLTKQQISKKIDSITTIRIKDLDNMAQQDLQRRMKIEVKIKVDSILNVMKIKSDSAVNATTVAKAKDTAAHTTVK